MMAHCKPLPDDFIEKEIKCPEDIIGHFAPGNYNPTKEEARCLIKCAVESVIRWYEINDEKLRKPTDPTEGLDKEDDPNTKPVVDFMPDDEKEEWEQYLRYLHGN